MNREINFDNMNEFPEKDVAVFLNDVITQEMEKGTADMDSELIEESVLFLRQLQGKEEYKTTEKFKAKAFEKVIKRYEAPTSSRKGISIKKLFIIAAAAILLSTLATIVAVADDPFTFINKLFLDTHIDDISNGETISKGNITVTRSDKTTVYNSIEDMVEKEKLSGIWFPADLQISNLTISEYNKATNLVIIPSNQTAIFTLNISSNDKYGLQYNVPTYKKTTTENGIDVWEYDRGESESQTGRYQLMFKINGWYYCIATSYPEQGYELINNFTEVAPWKK